MTFLATLVFLIVCMFMYFFVCFCSDKIVTVETLDVIPCPVLQCGGILTQCGESWRSL